MARTTSVIISLAMSAAAGFFFGYCVIAITAIQSSVPGDSFNNRQLLQQQQTLRNDATLLDDYSSYNAQRSFEQTLRSCLSPKCFDQPVESDLNRIGVLSIPGAGAATLQALLKAKNNKRSDIEVYFDTHVPAYGTQCSWTKPHIYIFEII